MSVLFIGKRFYTNRDALREKFGRIYQLPKYWAASGISTRLWLVDYHSREIDSLIDGTLRVESFPAISWTGARKFVGEAPFWGKHKDKPRTVVASGDCYIGIAGYHLARRLRARFVFDVYDKYDEFPTYRRFAWFDPFKFLLKHSDVRLFASRALAQEGSSQSARNFVVPNGVDIQRFRPLDMHESRRSLGLPEATVFIGYFGSMEPERGVDDLIDAVERVRNDGVDIEVLLGGKKRDDLNTGRASVRYLGNVLFENVPLALACCNLLAIPYRRSTFMDSGASNKIAEAIACHRPLVATRTPNFIANFPEQASMLHEKLAEPGNVVDIARVIRAQISQRVLVGMPAGMDWLSIAEKVADDLALSRTSYPSW